MALEVFNNDKTAQRPASRDLSGVAASRSPGFLEANLRTGLAGAHCPEMAGFFPCSPSTAHNAA